MVLALVPLLLQVLGAPAQEGFERLGGAELVVRSWLTLEAVDARGRRPFRPDAVLARHLVAAGSPAPSAEEVVTGESGEARWQARTAGEDGRVGDAAWAYTRVESEAARVVLARLEGAATLFVNGAPFVGDLYGFGFGGVPVALRAGANELYVNGVRGAFRLTLAPCEPGVQFGAWDLTLPTLAVGEPVRCASGVLLFNASTEPAEVVLEVVEEGGEPLPLGTETTGELPTAVRVRLAPLGLRKVGLEPRLARSLDEPGSLALRVRLKEAGREPRELELAFPVRAASEVGVRTFTSLLDGSVQKYAVRRPSPGRDAQTPLRLLLSLHGAGVDCEGQAAAYAAKPDFWIVAPTNRRPFGFDWQDWGRLDAYEVLRDVRHEPELAAAPLHLTGHSMGGHGTWHLASNDPDRFASIAPSAGWRSFDSYGGRPEGALRALWHAADAASRTEQLLSNLVPIPTYVLHGEADDNVPAAEGHAMVAALSALGAEPRAHFEPGAGHWWDDASGAPGAACLDWPGFFELFRATLVPPAPETLDWTGVDPGIDSRHHWVGVEQVLDSGASFHVRATYLRAHGRVRLETRNVRRLALTLPEIWSVHEAELDGRILEWDGKPASFVRGTEGWASAPELDSAEKHPDRTGPLKRAFDAGFVLVVPTAGTPEENAASLARARFDAQTWWVRGNGDAELFTDAEYLAHGPLRTSGPDGPRPRNVILYGNADTNAAWKLVPADFPLEVRRGSVRLGEAKWEGDALGALALGPVEHVLFAVLGSSGPAADRAAASLSLFVSGVGYPDYVVYGPEVLAVGDGGVRAAGFFDHRWRLPQETSGR